MSEKCHAMFSGNWTTNTIPVIFSFIKNLRLEFLIQNFVSRLIVNETGISKSKFGC